VVGDAMQTARATFPADRAPAHSREGKFSQDSSGSDDELGGRRAACSGAEERGLAGEASGAVPQDAVTAGPTYFRHEQPLT
jgi:hypothetical protein